MASVKGKTKIYRKDFNGKPVYSRKISSQKYENGQKGDWVSVYENVQLPKGADIADNTLIDFEGFEAVYEAKDGTAKRKLVVTDYRVAGDDMARPAAEENNSYNVMPEDVFPF